LHTVGSANLFRNSVSDWWRLVSFHRYLLSRGFYISLFVFSFRLTVDTSLPPTKAPPQVHLNNMNATKKRVFLHSFSCQVCLPFHCSSYLKRLTCPSCAQFLSLLNHLSLSSISWEDINTFLLIHVLLSLDKKLQIGFDPCLLAFVITV